MKLKYYLRGLGVGVVLTAVIMGVVLGGGKAKMSDEEVIKRAKQLGMVEAESTLSSLSDSTKIPEVTDEAEDTASDQKVVQAGEEVSEEVNEGESQTGESVPEMATETSENGTTGESSESIESEEDVKLAPSAASENASTDVVETPGKQEADQAKPETEVVTADNNETTTANDTATNNANSGTVEAQAKTNETATPAADAASSASQEAPAAEAPASTTVSSDVNYVVVVLPSGSESDTCARILREAGVIDDGVAFNKYLVSSGLDRKIRSGTKQIPRGSSFEEIASIITR